MSVREIPHILRTQARIALASAWEALVDTHSAQAVPFIQEFASRITVLEALELYLRVGAVPDTMREVVRSRTLLGIDLACLPARIPLPVLSGFDFLLPHRIYAVGRRRREHRDTTLQLAQLVGARAEEAILQTHVSSAMRLVRLLQGTMSAEKVAAYYIREFALPLAVGHAVYRRVQALVAGEQLAAQYTREVLPAREELETWDGTADGTVPRKA
jgi:hypothetical protein